MTTPFPVITHSDAETRWQHWQARGAKSERRTATRMRKLMLLLVAGLVVSFLAQLT